MNRKYEFTGETKTTADGVTLHRIRALVDMPSWHVLAGKVGGWVEGEYNLAVTGDAWVDGDAEVYGEARVAGSAFVSDYATVCGSARIAGMAVVGGHAKVYGNAFVDVSAQVDGCAHVYEFANVRGRAEVGDCAAIRGAACVTDDALVRGNAVVSCNARVFGFADISRSAFIVLSSDYLHAVVTASGEFEATLTRQNDGTAWLTVGCWAGTLDGFRAMIESDSWVEATPEQRELRRPELLAFADMCEARAKTWQGDAA